MISSNTFFNLFTFFFQYSDMSFYSEVEKNLSHEVRLIYTSVAHSVIHNNDFCFSSTKNHITNFILSTQNPSSPSQNDVVTYSSQHGHAKLHAHAPASTSNSNPPPPGNMSAHYEVDEDYEDPYWDPSSMEDELRMQLQKLKVQEIPREDLQ